MASIRFLHSRKRWQVRWHVTIQHGPNAGDVKSGSQTFLKKEKAEIFLRHINSQEDSWAAGMGMSSEFVSKAKDLFHEHISQFTPRTQGLYKPILDNFIKSLPAKVRAIDQITTTHIRKYLVAKSGSMRTKNIHLTVIKSFCKFLHETYGIANVSTAIKKFKEAEPDARFLNEKEYNVIFKIAPPAVSDMLLWIANTGVRATEFCNQRWCDISQDQKSIEIFGKGGKTRPVPLNNTCRAILARQTKLSDNDFIFKNLRGGILNRYALFQYCSEISKHPEFKKISKRPFGPHALRHWFATSLLLRGVSIQLVSKLLGHASIQITEKTYIHILPKHLEGITDCL